ncbi:hypothetical protein UFOVP1183_3 [uncultured Caudovirales phage]|uniref:Uncharacterized protein n=1 Tax=uncultured Caudovirales phage TaxID=2100421 RepID=A0A6J5Q1P0_9CAUD|nr:hypothetical protein UFOVP955_30 [uncultured Caudovirales phage]CAB4185152.1 hypothetical protein UFOVP1120_9 [uncultured Caudovirales phage]CAB4188175.1 hypothetical protein UFOVP1183_3 [uncultured Caudovirales phage]CAB4191410.1 hypothetical protein UFOVP1227_35 [uncultured Caudovirales phage]CAB5229627.1 hypothetical protein UFOVP1571_9 [uncultured Caudovirales phage]
MKVTMYIRAGDVIVAATATAAGPDGLDELRVQTQRAFAFAFATAENLELDPVDLPANQPIPVDTDNLPPLEPLAPLPEITT